MINCIESSSSDDSDTNSEEDDETTVAEVDFTGASIYTVFSAVKWIVKLQEVGSVRYKLIQIKQ